MYSPTNSTPLPPRTYNSFSAAAIETGQARYALLAKCVVFVQHECLMHPVSSEHAYCEPLLAAGQDQTSAQVCSKAVCCLQKFSATFDPAQLEAPAHVCMAHHLASDQCQSALLVSVYSSMHVCTQAEKREHEWSLSVVMCCRLFAGIHFPHDVIDGRIVGNQVGFNPAIIWPNETAAFAAALKSCVQGYFQTANRA